MSSAAKAVFEDILATTKDEYVYFSPPDETIRTRAPRVAAKNGRRYDPSFDEERAALRRIRSLPSYVDLKATVYLCGNSVGIVSTRREAAAAIIASPDPAFSLRQLFEFMWGVSR